MAAIDIVYLDLWSGTWLVELSYNSMIILVDKVCLVYRNIGSSSVNERAVCLFFFSDLFSLLNIAY